MSASPRPDDLSDVACPFCGLVCDDLVVGADSGRLTVKANGCALAAAAFRDAGDGARRHGPDRRPPGDPAGGGGRGGAAAARGADSADRGTRDRRRGSARRGPAGRPPRRRARSHELGRLPAQRDGAAGQRLDHDHALRSAQSGRPADRGGRRRAEPVSALLRALRRQPGDAVRRRPRLRGHLPGPRPGRPASPWRASRRR